MGQKIADFLKKLKATVIWTGWHLLAAWLIFKLLFNFNIFTLHLRSLHLHGFSGFAFGAILLAAPALLIAGAVMVWRTGMPIFRWKKKAKPEPKSEKEIVEAIAEPIKIEFPASLPEELRIPYQRAKTGELAISHHGMSLRQAAAQAATRSDKSQAELEMPIPEDFDTETNDIPSMPMFREIRFDNDRQPGGAGFDKAAPPDIIIENNTATAIHDDPDFWIADEENWFASGKQKPSPIAALLQHDGPRVLVLKETNIMDLENLRAKWQALGIQVV